MHPARWWHKEPSGKLLCTLCPRYCKLGDGQAGFCFIRKNEGGELVSLGYGAHHRLRRRPHREEAAQPLPARHADPLVRHRRLQPRLQVLPELGHVQGAPRRRWPRRRCRPAQVIDLAVAQGCPSVAMTYNDPVIWAEFAIDIARGGARARRALGAGHRRLRHRRGAPRAVRRHRRRQRRPQGVHRGLLPQGHLRHLEPVLETLKWIKRETKVWLEITNLMIPGLNDDESRDQKARRVGRHRARRPTCRCTSPPSTPTSRCATSRPRRRRR